MLRQVEKYLAMGAVEGWKRGHRFWKNSPTLFLGGALHPHSRALICKQFFDWSAAFQGLCWLSRQKANTCWQPSPPSGPWLLLHTWVDVHQFCDSQWLVSTPWSKQNCAGARRACFYSGWWPSSWSTFLSTVLGQWSGAAATPAAREKATSAEKRKKWTCQGAGGGNLLLFEVFRCAEVMILATC